MAEMKFKNLALPVKPLFLAGIIYVILAITAASQAYLLTGETIDGGKPAVTKYNNYVIFKCSFHHLLEGENLYSEYPDQHWDLYKYSPTFSLFFGCFAWLPDWLGLSLWNLLNVAALFIAIWLLPGFNDRQKTWILVLATVDTMTSLQNSQSNVLLAGLLLLGFGLFERRNYFLATLCIVSTFYIKLYGIAAIMMLLFYPERRKAIFYTMLWFFVLWILPVIITGWDSLLTMYGQYAEMLKHDQSVSVGISVMGWLKSWFGLDVPKTLLPLAGLAIMLMPLAGFRQFKDFCNRMLFFCALMIWMVIFNHKAESPTFIIATAGVYLWFFSEARSKVNIILLVLAVIFTSLSATDLFPAFIRTGFFEPYNIKVIPCVLVWIKILFELFASKPRQEICTG